jgi:hypothetical protein
LQFTPLQLIFGYQNGFYTVSSTQEVGRRSQHQKVSKTRPSIAHSALWRLTELQKEIKLIQDDISSILRESEQKIIRNTQIDELV